MRRMLSCLLTGLLLVLPAGMIGPVIAADTPAAIPAADPAVSAASTLPNDPEVVLERGLDQERVAELVGGHRDLSRRR